MVHSSCKQSIKNIIFHSGVEFIADGSYIRTFGRWVDVEVRDIKIVLRNLNGYVWNDTMKIGGYR